MSDKSFHIDPELPSDSIPVNAEDEIFAELDGQPTDDSPLDDVVVTEEPVTPRELPRPGQMLRIVSRTYDAVTFGETSRSIIKRNPDGSPKRTITSVTHEIIITAKSWCKSDDIQRQISVYSNKEQYEARKQSLLDSIATAKRHLEQLEQFHVKGPELTKVLQEAKDSDYEILIALWDEREALLQARRLDRLRATLIKRSAQRAEKSAALQLEKTRKLAEQSALHQERLKTAERIAKLTGESVQDVLKGM